MAFKRIRLYHYRNLIDSEVEISSKQVFLVGENGQGKTNFLESIYLLCFGSSFRTRSDIDLIKHGENDMSVAGAVIPATGGAGSPEVSVHVQIKNRKKTITVDEKRIRDRKELIERLPGIVFCHEDIEFVAGPPDRRRWFFNQTMSLNLPVFVDLLRRYSRVISMRNAAIKSGDFGVLPLFDEQAAVAGLEIQEKRNATVEEFNRSFSDIFRFVSGLSAPVTIGYSPSWKNCSNLDDALERMRDARSTDATMMTSTTGPHRDRFVFIAEGKNFARTASTGQLRLLSLVLRVAQAVHFYEITRALPILLLDDVLLELDGEKRKRFIETLPEYDQAFFTFLPDERYDRYRRDDTMVYAVTDGSIGISSEPTIDSSPDPSQEGEL